MNTLRRNDNVPYDELYVDPLLYFTFHILLEAFNKTPSNLKGRVPQDRSSETKI